MRILDLYCGGGGAGKGLASRGAYVEGWDLTDQTKYYPETFRHGSALDLTPEYIATFDLVWASPPCQRFSKSTKRWGRNDDHPDLVDETRDLLTESGVPFVLENVEGAPLRPDLMLCGPMVGLDMLRRHRIFEVHGFDVAQPEHAPHVPGTRYITVTGHTGGSSKRDGAIGFGTIADWRKAMDIDWLPARLMALAIPPAYSAYVLNEFLNQGES